MARRVLRCAVEEVVNWHPQLFLEPHLVGCVAVLMRYSESPAVFDVECADLASRWLKGTTHFRLEVSWTEETADKAERLRVTMQSRPLVEVATIALAMVLVRRVVPLAPLDVTDYGDRADYRSLSARRVLEISGTERFPSWAGATGKRSLRPWRTPSAGTLTWSSVPFPRGDTAFDSPVIRGRKGSMTKPTAKPYPQSILELMAEKTAVLSKARALADLGMGETASPLWTAAASYEERLAPLLEALGREPEAAVHRVSAASCYQKAGEFSRAANLYRAALSGPLRDDTRQEVRQMLAVCLSELIEAMSSAV